MEKLKPVNEYRRMAKGELTERLHSLQTSLPPARLLDAHQAEIKEVLQELEIYQIELEMQNRELRESQQALEVSNDRYINLYDFAPVGYVTLSDQGIIKEINLTAASMLGVERRWLMDHSLAPWIMGTDLPLFRDHLKQCREKGGNVRSTARLVRRDKQIIPVELSTSCLTDPSSGITLLRTTIADLTERRKAEADLDRFFGLSADLLCIIGVDGYFKRVNPACERVLGYSAKELLSHPLFDFIHPDDREASLSELVRQTTEGAGAADFQNRYIKKDRSTVWLSWTSMTSAGQLFCVGRDITAEIEAKKIAENQYNWLKEMVELLPLPMLLLEAETATLVSMTKASEEIYKGIPPFISDIDKSESYCADAKGRRLPSERWTRMRAARGEELDHTPVIWKTPQATYNLLVSSCNIPARHNQPAMALLVAQDVTPLKQSEKSLHEAVDKLNQERTLREQFVSALTHDLRTPLTAAKMSAQLLVRQINDPSVVNKLSGHIIQGIDRIDHMIEDLLDANRIQAGEKLPLKLSEFDLSNLLKETMNELTVLHGKRFVVKAQAPLRGRWSKHGLRRIIENLANNAIKYGDPDQLVTLSLERNPKAVKCPVVISIHNFGKPIPQEEQAALFQQFRRTRAAEKGEQKGWGIGLTLVRGIVEAHGGEISVQSSADEGTTFRVVLPLKTDTDEQPPALFAFPR